MILGGNVFPAPAGINRCESNHSNDEECVPRASGDKPLNGDKPYRIRELPVLQKCSPRQRG
ncbi:TPA: hypothetical protein MEB04_004311 [Klebsiella pneumoniae]|uniref:hypothetical protein n=1 Tax=Klebsiella pneumoniae TaxID=573 RepID=UPI000AD596C3|nr:hypothetical protein [Klebsiella pneumoniae]HBW1372872.1 hypothetical protein [Klebsiella pneumoniae]HBW2199414.1 hypothetical protein [Klebsiella pneumoniae]